MAGCSRDKTHYLRQQRRPQSFLGGVKERWHPASVSGWMQPFRTFRKWQYPDVIPSVTKLLVVPLNEVANQRQEARHRLILVDEAVQIGRASCRERVER